MDSNKIYFTNIGKNEDGTYNFHQAAFHDEELKSGGDETNIVLESEDLNTGLRLRVLYPLEVFVKGEAVGLGLVGAPEQENSSEAVSEVTEASLQAASESGEVA